MQRGAFGEQSHFAAQPGRCVPSGLQRAVAARGRGDAGREAGAAGACAQRRGRSPGAGALPEWSEGLWGTILLLASREPTPATSRARCLRAPPTRPQGPAPNYIPSQPRDPTSLNAVSDPIPSRPTVTVPSPRSPDPPQLTPTITPGSSLPLPLHPATHPIRPSKPLPLGTPPTPAITGPRPVPPITAYNKSRDAWMGQTPRPFKKLLTAREAGVGRGLAAPSHEVEVPEGRLLRGREGPRVAGRAQRRGLARELLVEVADVGAARQGGHEGRRQAPGQQGVPAQSLQGGRGQVSRGGGSQTAAGGGGGAVSLHPVQPRSCRGRDMESQGRGKAGGLGAQEGSQQAGKGAAGQSGRLGSGRGQCSPAGQPGADVCVGESEGRRKGEKGVGPTLEGALDRGW